MNSKQEKNEDETISSALATGLYWSHNIISATLEFVIFLVIGYFLDKYFSTSPWLLLVFGVFGMFAMFHRILQIAKEAGEENESKEDERR
jgi:F0F1-type ATP synthase assembly protein I